MNSRKILFTALDNFKKRFSNRLFRIGFICAVSLVLVYIILRIVYYPSDPLQLWLKPVFNAYLLFPEWMANLVFKATDAGVAIRDHTLIYDYDSFYQANYDRFISDWPRYLLYKRWSALILVLIWGTISPWKKKLKASVTFLVVHVFAVVGGLYLMGVIAPAMVNEQTKYFLSPTIVGTLALYTFLIFWVKLNKQVIRITLQRVGIHLAVTDRKINEILILLLFFMLIREFFIPYIDYKSYVYFMLESTRRIAALLGFQGYISGDQLVGDYGAVALSKHCLGFMTMYIFAALVYLVRLKEKRRANWIFISSGLVFLLILNIIRMLLIFIIAQGENGYERASRHHEIYNAVIYVVIFVLWVVWYEFFILKEKKKIARTEA